jgi:N-acetylated-alpha-linked acidic dipeptidase
LKETSSILNTSIQGRLETKSSNLEFNHALFQAEKQLLNPDGLPGRPWYKHSVYAPGLYTGYGVKTLPGVREAIEQYNENEARQQIALLAAAVSRLSETLSQLNSSLKTK